MPSLEPIRRNGEPWSREENLTLEMLLGRGETPAYVARVLSRSVGAVMTHHQLLTGGPQAASEATGWSFPARQGQPWEADEEVRLLRLRFQDHRPWPEIATLMGRSEAACEVRYAFILDGQEAADRRRLELKQERQRAISRTATKFKARYPSVCPACRRQINQGDQACWTQSGQVAHVSCPEP